MSRPKKRFLEGLRDGLNLGSPAFSRYVFFGLALSELLLSRDFFRPTFLKALLFERLFSLFSSL
jgi:hypothetical protein